MVNFPLTPTVVNVTVTNANTEYSQVIPAGTKYFEFRLRDTTKVLRYAWLTGKVATPTAPYATLPANDKFVSPPKLDLTNDGKTIYFGCPDASQVVEIVYWS